VGQHRRFVGACKDRAYDEEEAARPKGSDDGALDGHAIAREEVAQEAQHLATVLASLPHQHERSHEETRARDQCRHQPEHTGIETTHGSRDVLPALERRVAHRSRNHRSSSRDTARATNHLW